VSAPAVSVIKTPEGMLALAQVMLADGADPAVLLRVAIAHRDKWARLVERQEAGEVLDGRASIYSGETYTQARDRWDAYRVLLLAEVGNATHGGLS
jgi:hypothetical protein